MGTTNTAALPPITADLVLTAVLLEVRREVRGMRLCARDSIGAMRRRLGPVTPETNPTDTVRNGAVVLLGDICRVCPHVKCDMKSWDIMR